MSRLDVGRRCATQIGQRSIGRGDLRLGRVDLGLDRFDLALCVLQAGRVGCAQRSKRRLCTGQCRIVRIDRALLGLTDTVVGAVHQRGHLGFGSREAGLGGLDVFDAPASAHVLQTCLLLRNAGLCRGDIFGPGPALQAGHPGLRLGERGSGEQELRLWVVLIEDGDRVAGFHLRAHVHEDLFDAASGLGQNADLLARANVTAIRKCLLNAAAGGGLGAYRLGWRRRRRRGGGGGRPLATRGDQQCAGQRAAEQEWFDRA